MFGFTKRRPEIKHVLTSKVGILVALDVHYSIQNCTLIVAIAAKSFALYEVCYYTRAWNTAIFQVKSNAIVAQKSIVQYELC